MKNISQRTLSGILFLIVIIGSFFLGGAAVSILVILTGSAALYEFNMLGGSKGSNKDIIAVITGGSVIMAAAYFEFSQTCHNALIPSAILVLMFLMIYSIFSEKGFNIFRHAFGMVYIILPMVLALYMIFPAINGYRYTHRILLGVFILIWLNDTGAYITGISAGRHPLFRRISPKKTWEGVAGGTLVSVAAALFMDDIMGILGMSDWIIIGMVVSVFGVTGDLFESMLKRNAGVKDSGNLMPGHGGILDRIDSMLFVIPIVFVYLTLIN